MSWRFVPPALSPVAPMSLLSAATVATRLGGDDRAYVAARLRAKYGAVRVVLTDSGTSALRLALQAVVPRGGVVAYPAYACIDLTSAALGADVRVRLYDLDPATLSPDLDSIRAAIGRGVDAIVVAHLFGYAADVVAVKAIAAEYGVPVIEDAAQAAGGSLSGKLLGSLGDLSVLSFGRGKGTTGGSGGALLVPSGGQDSWARRDVGSLGASGRGGREVAVLAAQWLLARPALYRLPASIPGLRLGEMVFHPPRPPRGISWTAAALMRGALARENREVEIRRENAASMLRHLHGSGTAPVNGITASNPGYLRLALLDSSGGANLRAELGVVRGYPLSVDQHAELGQRLVSGERAGSGSSYLRDRLFTVPTHSRVSASDRQRIVESLTRSVSAGTAHLAPATVS